MRRVESNLNLSDLILLTRPVTASRASQGFLLRPRPPAGNGAPYISRLRVRTRIFNQWEVWVLIELKLIRVSQCKFCSLYTRFHVRFIVQYYATANWLRKCTVLRPRPGEWARARAKYEPALTVEQNQGRLRNIIRNQRHSCEQPVLRTTCLTTFEHVVIELLHYSWLLKIGIIQLRQFLFPSIPSCEPISGAQSYLHN